MLVPFLTACFLFCVFYVRVRRNADGTLHLPGPSTGIASFLWGHELLVFEHNATEMYTSWARAFGPIFKIKAALFHPDIVVVTDHIAVQHIFADTTTYVKSPAFRPPISNLLGEGLVWAEGEDHAKQRKCLAPAFSRESVRAMSSTICECAEKLAAELSNQALQAQGLTTVNILSRISACTLDIIGLVGFGHDFRALSSLKGSAEAREIRESWDGHVTAAVTFPAFLAPLIVRAVPMILRVPLPVMRTHGVVRRIVGKLACGIVDRRRREQPANAGSFIGRGKDILSLMMNQGGAAGLLDQEIIHNIVTFTMVGHETTAGSLAFTIWELAKHPELQTRLREEIIQQGGDLGFDDVEKLEFLDAVIKEGLRLHAASPQTERVALRDDAIPLETPIRTVHGHELTHLTIKKGQIFHIPFTTMNTNPSVWGPDAVVFSPDRWLKPNGIPAPSQLPRGWSGILTFCDGPRNCIGQRLAVFEAKVILATLVRSLEFHDTGASVRPVIARTLQPVVDGEVGLLPIQVGLVH
ncbi:cytochrome P450 [Fistulina hepatica ATCC 64428]|uniref:Cytochrome P450 n=1 Tax=Fistulina hepatica ATCC 64428 TaxID=1128425 RepID=A0A0D7ADL7_9AGAR|nr:cytochrome P450 [Fistulina hepatica ATCC 64428]